VVLENAKATLRDHTPAATTSSPIGAYSTGLGDPEAIDENALQISQLPIGARRANLVTGDGECKQRPR